MREKRHDRQETSKGGYCIMSLQGCVATVVQNTFLSSDITPKGSLLMLLISVLVLMEDTPILAHV